MNLTKGRDFSKLLPDCNPSKEKKEIQPEGLFSSWNHLSFSYRKVSEKEKSREQIVAVAYRIPYKLRSC